MVAAKDRRLFEIFAAIELINIVLSFISNFFLILIVIKTAKVLGNYRFLLLAFAVNDIWFPFVHLLTLPIACSYRDAFIMFSNGFLTSKFSICLFASTFSQTMPIFGHLFIYRLVVLKWPNLARFYSFWNTFAVVLASILIQLVLWFANCWFNYASDDELRRYVQPFLDEEFSGGEEGREHIGALYYNERGLRAPAVWATMGFNAIMLFWFTIIFVCAILTVRLFRGKLANKTRLLQKQLFKTLIIQMTVPIFCVYLPCGGIINFPMLFRMSVFPNLAPAVVTFFPVVDALLTLVCVKVFRFGNANVVASDEDFKGQNWLNLSSYSSIQLRKIVKLQRDILKGLFVA